MEREGKTKEIEREKMTKKIDRERERMKRKGRGRM